MRRDPHLVLGVPHGASPAVVLEAFRRLSKLHHPDTGGSAERFVEIHQAYEALRARSALLDGRSAAIDGHAATAGRPATPTATAGDGRAGGAGRHGTAGDGRAGGADPHATAGDGRAADGTLDERLAALERELREKGRGRPGRDARADATVRGVNDLIDGLDGLASQLD